MASANAPDKIAQTDHHESISNFSKSFFSRREPTLANDLPPELLVYIFETAQNTLLPSEHLFRHFPFILGGVSQYWRQVAFTAPKLWLNVDISHPRDLAALQGYLERSKRYPIDLNLVYDNAFTVDVIFDAEVTQLIDILQPHYSRCRSIKLLGTCRGPAVEMEMMKILISMSNSRYPLLNRFLVQLPEVGDKIRPQTFGYEAPNLTSVFLCGLGLNYCRPPLNAVTELHLAVQNNVGIDGGDFSEMLRACAKSLITLCTYDDLVRTWPARIHSIAMPCLRHLRIFGPLYGFSELLLLISAPDLEELTIAPIYGWDLSTLLENHKNPKFPALKSLTLAPSRARAMGLAMMEASECFPGIGLLILPNYYKHFLRGSFLTENGAARWPRLHSLAVRIGGSHDESALYDLVKDRQRVGVPLRTLYVDSSSVSRMTRMDWLKDQLTVVEADLWKIQRRDGFYSDEENRFIGLERELS